MSLNIPENYIELNRNSWNSRTEHHVVSEFYDVKNFLAGKNSLKEFELNLLGEVEGKNVLHLQCHFGQDTLSLARMGAKVTGVDFSEEAINYAKMYNEKLSLNAEFICCDIYKLKENLDKKFDIVFTTYGVLSWLPDLKKWAEIISYFLKPNGKLIFVEFHPVVWMLDEHFKEIKYNYFNTESIVEFSTGTYANRHADVEYQTVSWNHSLGEVMNALLENNLEIISFNEYNFSPYNCFNETEKIGENKFRIRHLENKIPMTYSIVAKKKN